MGWDWEWEMATKRGGGRFEWEWKERGEYLLICNMAVTLHVYVLNALNDGQLFIKQAM